MSFEIVNARLIDPATGTDAPGGVLIDRGVIREFRTGTGVSFKDAAETIDAGGLCLVALPLLAWLWLGSLTMIATLAVIGLMMAVAAWVYPRAIAPLFIGLMLITAPIGMVVGELAMFLIYITVFMPIGIFFRITKRDGLQLKLDRKASSYWQPKRQPRSVASYYRQS